MLLLVSQVPIRAVHLVYTQSCQWRQCSKAPQWGLVGGRAGGESREMKWVFPVASKKVPPGQRDQRAVRSIRCPSPTTLVGLMFEQQHINPPDLEATVCRDI